MKTAVFSTKPYDTKFLVAANVNAAPAHLVVVANPLHHLPAVIDPFARLVQPVKPARSEASVGQYTPNLRQVLEGKDPRTRDIIFREYAPAGLPHPTSSNEGAEDLNDLPKKPQLLHLK